ncbi:MAG: HAD family hydrolase [Deltaproteobacteria bacterium]|nr:HAD family hydrolase [Deltaproteobacteria bacterium]
MAGIIFDLDGTLIDSIADIGAAANRVLGARGLPNHSTADYRTMLGHGVRVLLRKALPDGYFELDEVVNEFRADYWDHLLVDTEPFPGIRELLAELGAAGHRLAVLSNKPHRFTARIGEAMFADSGFVEFWGHKDEYAKKPDPTSANELRARLGTEPGATYFIGDSAVDIDTGKAAGMHPIGVSWGYQPVELLRQSDAEVVLETPADLLSVVR